ncbi:MAG: serine/threonine protein kinase, partial [Planctomycetes bacterium]|nr:serine/threonine protein kinase [Planctomycetota bacterium]
MNDESKRRKDALLHRYLDGEIDKPTYDAMLARLESQPPEPPEASPPGDDLDRMATVGRASPMGRLEPGVDLGGFRLVEIIGCGGMGQVWKAHDPTADRTVVVKVVPPDVQHNAAEMARVRDTFRRIHTLHHEHICPVYVLGEDPRCGHFVVMQFIAGRPLSEYRRERTEGTGVLTLTETIRILRPVAAALDYAHRQKVVHRDVKPDNILVTGDGDDVQVVDFGLAAEIHTSMSRVSNVTMETSGTRPYMAPEQWRGEYQDARTDQYALAVVAYELLAGRLPFESADAEILRLCVLNESPPEIGDQDDSVNGALARGMAKRREDRFADCTEFIAALEAAAPGDVEPGEDDPPIVAEETSPETGSPLPAFIAAAPPVQVDPEPPIVLQPAAP